MHDDQRDTDQELHGRDATETPVDPLTAVLAVEEPRREESAGDTSLLTGSGGAVESEGEETAGDAPADEYEFSWPEGYVPDPGVMARFVPLARRLGLSRDGAQELASLYAALDAERAGKQAQFIARNNREWLEEIRSHPEFGGANLERSGQAVTGLLRRYGSPLLAAQIRQMNIGNWPEMFYFLARLSRATAEDCSPSGDPAPARDRSAAQVLFPDLR